jgi:hypothetical protein
LTPRIPRRPVKPIVTVSPSRRTVA